MLQRDVGLLGGLMFALVVVGTAAAGLGASGACSRALVIVDVQKLYLSQAVWLTADGGGLVEKIEPLLAAARENGIPVIYVQHVNNPGMSATSPGVWFPDAIAPREGELVIQKRFPSAFQETPFKTELEARGITDLILTGLSSVGCLDATLRDALSLGFAVTAIADAHSAAEGVRTTAAKNGTWEALGAMVRWSKDIDFAGLCPKTP